MAKIEVPVQVNLPEDWLEQILDRLKNDPESEWAQVVRCKDCKWNKADEWVDCVMNGMYGKTTNNFCSRAERREE